MIPPLDQRGLLPPGVHRASWGEVSRVFSTNAHRQTLIANAQSFSAEKLLPLHPSELYLAGSTFSDKEFPSDIEATIKVNPIKLDPEQCKMLFQLQAGGPQIKEQFKVDFHVTIEIEGTTSFMDFTKYFQYVGEKTAIAKGLHYKDPRGIIEVEKWNQT